MYTTTERIYINGCIPCDIPIERYDNKEKIELQSGKSVRIIMFSLVFFSSFEWAQYVAELEKPLATTKYYLDEAIEKYEVSK